MPQNNQPKLDPKVEKRFDEEFEELYINEGMFGISVDEYYRDVTKKVKSFLAQEIARERERIDTIKIVDPNVEDFGNLDKRQIFMAGQINVLMRLKTLTPTEEDLTFIDAENKGQLIGKGNCEWSNDGSKKQELLSKADELIKQAQELRDKAEELKIKVAMVVKMYERYVK